MNILERHYGKKRGMDDEAISTNIIRLLRFARNDAKGFRFTQKSISNY